MDTYWEAKLIFSSALSVTLTLQKCPYILANLQAKTKLFIAHFDTNKEDTIVLYLIVWIVHGAQFRKAILFAHSREKVNLSQCCYETLRILRGYYFNCGG